MRIQSVKEGVKIKKLEMKDGCVDWRVIEEGREGLRKNINLKRQPKIIAPLNGQ